jgi:hypothetical protein
MNKCLLFSIFILFQSNQIFPQFGSQDTGGPLSPEWAAYDIKYYNINLNIDPENQTIGGWVGVTAEVVNDMNEFVLNLDDLYRITKIELVTKEAHQKLSFKHEGMTDLAGRKQKVEKTGSE